MNTNRLNYSLLAVVVLALASCAGTDDMQMVSSQSIPAAESTITVGKNDNGNTTFELTVKHLARPDRVDPGATVYVVWLRGIDASVPAQNMGALKVDDNLNGSYAGVTPLRDFELLVTAEPSSAGSAPTGTTLLFRAVSAK